MLVSSVVYRRIFYFSFLTPLILSSTTHNRRILHQPFVPQDSIPPIPSPNLPSFSPTTPTTNSSSSSSSTPPEAPFFPLLFSPPPPPSQASSASFPATVILPPASKSKRASSKLIATAVVAAVAAVVLFSIAVYLHFRKRRNLGLADTKTQTSNNSSRNHYPLSGRENIPNLQRPMQTSSELFYLGTLVSSHGGVSNEGIDHPQNSPFSDSVSLVSRKRDSPELRPLPPLSGQTVRNNHGNVELGVGGHDDEEEFYSPKGSLGAIGSSIGTGSASRRAFSAAELETFGGLCSSSSYLSSSSASDSPVRSASGSGRNSPPINLSPIKLNPNSPVLVAINRAPLRPPPPAPSLPPPPISLFRVSLVDQKESQSSSLSRSKSPSSSPSSISPERIYSKSRDTPPRVSNITNTHSDSPQLIRSLVPSPLLIPSPPPLPPPPPPPPPPLPVFESLRIPTPEATKFISKPPDLMAPLRPISVDNPSLISPIQLPPNLKIDGNSDKVLESNSNYDDNEDVSKPKLKPLHWDKVRASSDREMVWDQLKSSSFRLNEEMFETLFVAKAPNSTPMEATRWPVLPLPSQVNRILDAKKSQNIAILLKALNVTVDEVCDALVEGNADNLGTELLESLLKMAPSKEEERKLKEYKDDSPIKLGVAEKFLKAMLDIPFAFKRVEALLYISNFESEIEYLKNSFKTLEAACEELRKSRMFLKLLEAVLKTGNRMNIGTNRGDAQAFKLDTLLKLVDIKGADGKTTLLHFVVQEIIRTEGARLLNVNQNPTSTSVMNDDNNNDLKCSKLGLQVVSCLGSELNNVKKAAAMDSEVLHSDFLKLSNGLKGVAEVVKLNQTVGGHDEKTEFSMSMAKFIENSETDLIKTQAQESVALTLVKEITEYFHGNSAKEEARPFRIFMVVRDFLTVLDRVCREIGSINERITVSNAHKFPIPVNPTLQQTSSGFHGKRQYSDSEDESL